MSLLKEWQFGGVEKIWRSGSTGWSTGWLHFGGMRTKIKKGGNKEENQRKKSIIVNLLVALPPFFVNIYPLWKPPPFPRQNEETNPPSMQPLLFYVFVRCVPALGQAKLFFFWPVNVGVFSFSSSNPEKSGFPTLFCFFWNETTKYAKYEWTFTPSCRP